MNTCTHLSAYLSPVLRGCIAVLVVGGTPVLVAAQSEVWSTPMGELASPSSSERAQAVVEDGAGGAFVGGWTGGNLGAPLVGQYDVWMARLDATGKKLWAHQFGSTLFEEVQGVCGDGNGGTFASGFTEGDMLGASAGLKDVWLARFDAAGNSLWAVQFGSVGHDYSAYLAPDGSGGVLLAGSTNGDLGGGPPSGSIDTWVQRRNAAGQVLWSRHFPAAVYQYSAAAASDGAGGIYIAGTTDGAHAGAHVGGYDAWLMRVDSTGSLSWSRQLGSVANDEATALCVDGAGGVWMAGRTLGSLAGPSQGNWDVWLARFDSSGSLLDTAQWGNAPDPLEDRAVAVAPDGGGGVYASWCSIYPSFPFRKDRVWHLESDGDLLWSFELDYAPPNGRIASAAASDGAGGVILAGFGGVDDSDGWAARFDDSCGVGSSYCVASSTSITGCAAAISATGSPTLSNAGGFTINSGAVPGGNLGLMLFGNHGPASVPFGTLGGMVCVAGPTFRSAPKTNGGTAGQCNGNYAFTLQDLVQSSPIVTAGATIHAQFWARDPANPDGFLLSNGIEFLVCP